MRANPNRGRGRQIKPQRKKKKKTLVSLLSPGAHCVDLDSPDLTERHLTLPSPGIKDIHYHPQLLLLSLFSFEPRSPYVAQAGLELLDPSDPTPSALETAGIMAIYHHA